jgi:hypothetical protein
MSQSHADSEEYTLAEQTALDALERQFTQLHGDETFDRAAAADSIDHSLEAASAQITKAHRLIRELRVAAMPLPRTKADRLDIRLRRSRQHPYGENGSDYESLAEALNSILPRPEPGALADAESRNEIRQRIAASASQGSLDPQTLEQRDLLLAHADDDARLIAQESKRCRAEAGFAPLVWPPGHCRKRERLLHRALLRLPMLEDEIRRLLQHLY